VILTVVSEQVFTERKPSRFSFSSQASLVTLCQVSLLFFLV
jgi:hypothetical protein